MVEQGAKKKTTIYDVAAAADASVSTVSLVLNGDWSRYRIKEETSKRILETARDLGYKVNLRARGLRLSKSGLAGMILPHYRNRFFADLAETFEAGARKRDLCPIVVSTQRDDDVETKVVATLLAQRVEFLFIAGVADPSPLNRLCDDAGVACVNIDLPGPGAPSVVTDNKAGAFLVTQKLIETVRARGGAVDDMFFLGGVAGEYATENRVAGFLEAVRQAGGTLRPDLVACCGYRPQNASAALAEHVARRGALPSGLFISSITTFEGLMRYSASAGAALDCAVGCFDWDPFAAGLGCTVAMLRQDAEGLIDAAFACLDPERQRARAVLMTPPILERG